MGTYIADQHSQNTSYSTSCEFDTNDTSSKKVAVTHFVTFGLPNLAKKPEFWGQPFPDHMGEWQAHAFLEWKVRLTAAITRTKIAASLFINLLLKSR